MSKTIAFHKISASDERRIVTVLTTISSDKDANPIVDHDDDIISIDELEVAFAKSFAKGGRNMGGEMHEIVGGAHVIHHFTLSKGEWAALASEFEIPEMANAPEVGMAKLFIEDDDLWESVKNGDYPEVSMAGESLRRRVA